jgi:hypothetical protein
MDIVCAYYVQLLIFEFSRQIFLETNYKSVNKDPLVRSVQSRDPLASLKKV